MTARSAELGESGAEQRWWPLTCRFRPSVMSRSTATSFDGYRAPGTTDHLLRWPATDRQPVIMSAPRNYARRQNGRRTACSIPQPLSASTPG
jgi:hypothetical protein